MARRTRVKKETATEPILGAQDAPVKTPPVTGDVSEQPPVPTPAPNIRLSRMHPPVTEGALGWDGIVLPDEASQRAGWYEPKARRILQLYGGIYKIPVGRS